MIHLKHFKDGYPVCWPMDREGAFEGSFEARAVNCLECLKHLEEIKGIMTSIVNKGM